MADFDTLFEQYVSRLEKQISKRYEYRGENLEGAEAPPYSVNLFDKLRNRESNLGYKDCEVFRKNLYRERLRFSWNLYSTDVKGHYGCLNAIEFSPCGKIMVTGGLDRRMLMWYVDDLLIGRYNPWYVETQNPSPISFIAIDGRSHCAMSGGAGFINVSSLITGDLYYQIKRECKLLSLSIDPQNEDEFVTGCGDGCLHLYDLRYGHDPVLSLDFVSAPNNTVQYHPLDNNLVLAGLGPQGVALYDKRRPKKAVINYNGPRDRARACGSARFNRKGNLILSLGKFLPPILYRIDSPEILCTFKHGYYFNTCTRKTGCFVGEDDELIVSGSDDFSIYVWNISDVDIDQHYQYRDDPHMTLRGHRSIPSNVSYNYQHCLLASGGVEKTVKLWSPFNAKNWSGSLVETAPVDSVRPIDPFAYEVSTLPHLLQNRVIDSTEEDPTMLALFDYMLYKEYVMGGRGYIRTRTHIHM